MISNVGNKKAIMYAIICALESDFIRIFSEHLELNDIPKALIERSNRVIGENNVLLSYLMGLDIQAYIEICNANIEKLNIDLTQRRFINTELSKIIPIRNKVMHPRPVELTDYPILYFVAEAISSSLNQFYWSELLRTFEKIYEDPSQLQLPPMNVQKSSRIIENLPAVTDFDETSFIGRRKEIGEIKAKLKKNNVHVLSIIGDGGVGKTALAIRMLYDMLDDESCKFELILWTSLKTSQLSGYEFRRIDDAITTTAQMYSKLGEFVGNKGDQDTQAYLIGLAENFNTLLVLDNLETVNSDDVKSFIDDFTEYGKVLITSRIGLGEMEHRYRLEGLNQTDVLEYMNALLELYGYSGLLTDEQKLSIAQKQLHSNPLAIKWFVKSIHSGKSVDEVLAHKDDLINFCMSNVYDKLGENSRRILETIQILKTDLSVGELIYYTDSGVEDYAEISLAINELIKCNFLDDTKYRIQKVLSITQFASEFLESQIHVDRERKVYLREKNKQLAIHKQKLEQNKSTAPSANDTFFFYKNDNDRIVATFYLVEAIGALEAKKPVEEILRPAYIAQKIAPDYSECAATIGLCYADSNPEKARVEYDRAVEYCREDAERAFAHARYSRFLRSSQAYQESVDHLEEAVRLDPTSFTLKFELIMSLCWIYSFKRAKEIFEPIDYNTLDTNMQREYVMRYADMRRREAEEIAQSNPSKAFSYLKEAFLTLEKETSVDKRKSDLMANILCAMIYLYLNDEIIDFVISKLEVYYSQMRITRKYKKFKEVMMSKLSVVAHDKREILTRYVADAETILAKMKRNQGVVVLVRDEYGLFRVKDFEPSVYFSIDKKQEKYEIGDIVSYTGLTPGPKGYSAAIIKKSGDVYRTIIGEEKTI